MLLTSLVLAGSLLILYAAFLLSAVTWRMLRKRLAALHPALAADLALLLEIGPLFAALLVPALFIIPGFLKWEPANSSESIPLLVRLLAALAAAMLSVAAIRFGRMMVLHFSFVRELKRTLHSRLRPLIAVTGFLRSRIHVSQSATEMLPAEELSAVLAHERVHIARRDNLRELLARVTASLRPDLAAFRELDRARLLWAEQAADAAASSTRQTALDLASALVRLARVAVPPSNAMATFLIPDASASVIEARVRRLLEFEPAPLRTSWHAAFRLCAAGIALLVAVAVQPQIQFSIHRLIERVVAL